MINEPMQKDAIKLFVNLINRIKNGENISSANKLLNIEISVLPQKMLKMLIDVEMCNGSEFDSRKFQ